MCKVCEEYIQVEKKKKKGKELINQKLWYPKAYATRHTGVTRRLCFIPSSVQEISYIHILCAVRFQNCQRHWISAFIIPLTPILLLSYLNSWIGYKRDSQPTK